jgi:hypothetical protein
LHVAQLSALPVAAGILAIRHQKVIVKINVPAGLLIRSWRSRLCLGRNPKPHNEHNSDRRTSENAAHIFSPFNLAGIPPGEYLVC